MSEFLKKVGRNRSIKGNRKHDEEGEVKTQRKRREGERKEPPERWFPNEVGGLSSVNNNYSHEELKDKDQKRVNDPTIEDDLSEGFAQYKEGYWIKDDSNNKDDGEAKDRHTTFGNY